MGINKPIIPAGPTTQRGHITDYPIRTHGAAPGETYIKVADDGSNALEGTTVFPPTREGQVYFHTSAIDGNRQANMYVGVEIGGTLTWVRVSLTSSFTNSYTGQAFDPIYD